MSLARAPRPPSVPDYSSSLLFIFYLLVLLSDVLFCQAAWVYGRLFAAKVAAAKADDADDADDALPGCEVASQEPRDRRLCRCGRDRGVSGGAAGSTTKSSVSDGSSDEGKQFLFSLLFAVVVVVMQPVSGLLGDVAVYINPGAKSIAVILETSVEPQLYRMSANDQVPLLQSINGIPTQACPTTVNGFEPLLIKKPTSEKPIIFPAPYPRPLPCPCRALSVSLLYNLAAGHQHELLQRQPLPQDPTVQRCGRSIDAFNVANGASERGEIRNNHRRRRSAVGRIVAL